MCDWGIEVRIDIMGIAGMYMEDITWGFDANTSSGPSCEKYQEASQQPPEKLTQPALC